jgi:spore maturation protein CgeB
VHKIIVLDTLYPDFIRSLPFDIHSTYDVELGKVLDRQFGTFDAYSRNLRTIGWDAADVIVNHQFLQEMWGQQHDAPMTTHLWSILQSQIAAFNPDVCFLQDLNIEVTPRPGMMMAGQLSCPWPGDRIVAQFDVLFTSFPHYVPRIEELGVKAAYLPLAFDPIALEGRQPERDIDISFVGGVGARSHWDQGTVTIEGVASAFKERFHWYGYGRRTLEYDAIRAGGVEPPSTYPGLQSCHRGSAWGREMYDIYRRSKIVINRHGEIADGFANNLRMYEATGCGAMLLTDNRTPHFEGDEIVTYATIPDAIDKAQHYLSHHSQRTEIAEKGRTRTLRDHTYTQRMETVSDVLHELVSCVNGIFI